MTKMTVVEHNQDEMYELLKDEKGQFFLSILCGGVGVYEVYIRLTPEDVSDYLRNGTDSITQLSNRIRQNPTAFEDQVVTKLPER